VCFEQNEFNLCLHLKKQAMEEMEIENLIFQIHSPGKAMIKKAISLTLIVI